MTMRALWIVLGLTVLAFALWLAIHQQRGLAAALPPRVECVDRFAALAEAQRRQAVVGGEVIAVLGTGSMAPYLPAAAAGLDPHETVIAYLVTRPGATVDDVTPGALVAYYFAGASTRLTAHLAAARDADGWIMTGLHNDHYENATRVIAVNFRGLAAAVYTWPQTQP